MSDAAREIAAVALIRAEHPGAAVHFWGSDWHYVGTGIAIEAMDYSLQDIGGEPDDLGIAYRVDGQTEWLSDHDLPAPTLKPWCQAIHLARVIGGITE